MTLPTYHAAKTIDQLAARTVATARAIDEARKAYYAAPSDETMAAWDAAHEAHELATREYDAAHAAWMAAG